MLLPDSMEVRICVPFNSRSTAWASFDGRGRVELKRAWVICSCRRLSLTKHWYQRAITLRLQRASFHSPPFAQTNSQRTGSMLSLARSSGTSVSGKNHLSLSRRVPPKRSTNTISTTVTPRPLLLQVKGSKRGAEMKMKTIPMKRRKSSTLTTFRRRVVTLLPPPVVVPTQVSVHPRERRLHPLQRTVLRRQSWV